MRSRASRLLLWLSGADQEVLRHCPRERPKFVAVGGTVLTTAGLAFVAATFTAGQFLNVPWALALLVGVAWGLAIMNLDRWLLASIRRQKTTGMTVLMALPRLAMALIIGFVIAEPLVLRVFEAEVSTQAERDKQAAFAEGREDIRTDYAEIPQLEQRKAELEAEVTNVGVGEVLNESVAYQEAARTVRRLERRVAQAEQRAFRELDGSGGTNKRGDGPVYAAKARAVEQAKTQLAGARQSRDALRSGLLGDERQMRDRRRGFSTVELERVSGELTRQRRQRAQDLEDLDEKFAQDIGLLNRVEALENLTAEHGGMRVIRIMLLLFILCIDSLPVIAKLLMSIGRPSLYERVQDALDDSEAAGIEQQTAAYATASEITASLVVDEAATRKRFAKDVQDDLLRQAVDGMREAGERFVARWRSAVVASADDLADAELDRMGIDHRGGRNGNGQPDTRPRDGRAGAEGI